MNKVKNGVYIYSPPTRDSYATPTMHLVLLAVAATSPAHLVPCLLKDKYPNFEVGLKCILMVDPYLLVCSYIK